MFEYNEIHNAYIKLKLYMYHDSTNLFYSASNWRFLKQDCLIIQIYWIDSVNILTFKKAYNVEVDKNLQPYEQKKKLQIFTKALNQYITVIPIFLTPS